MRQHSSVKRTLLTFTLVLGISIPGLVLAIIISHYWVNIPHMDQWGISRVFDNYFERGLPLEDLISQHNESRKVVPRLIILGLGLISGWDVRWEICFTFVLACLISGTFYLHLRRITTMSVNQVLATLAMLNLFLFSPAQWGNWFMGLQLCVFVPLLMLSAGLLFNTSRLPLWSKLLVNIPCALAGTFSFANGMILWLLLIPPGIFSKHRAHLDRKTLTAFAGYIVCFSGTLLIYFRDYLRPAQSYPVGDALVQPLNVFRFLLLWLSTPIPAFNHVILQSAIGCAVLVLFVYISVSCFYHTALTRPLLYPWIIFGLYSLISGIAASMGRLGFGYDMALSSRYATPAVYLTVSVIALITLSVHVPFCLKHSIAPRYRWIQYAILGSFILLHFKAYIPALHDIAVLNQRLTKGKIALRLIDIIPDNRKLACIHTNRQFLEHRLKKIKGYDLLDFELLDPNTFDFNTPQASEFDRRNGRFESLTRIGRSKMKAAGWAKVVSGDNDDRAIIFVVTDSRGVSTPIDFVTLEDAKSVTRDRYIISPWEIRRFSGVITHPSFLTDGKILSAWLIDFDTHNTYRLWGQHTIKKHPGRSGSPGTTPPAVGGGRRSEM